MGIESRDWYRKETRRARSKSRSGRSAAVVGVVLLGLLVAVSPAGRDRLGYELPYGLEEVFRSNSTPGAMTFEPIPGGPSIALGGGRETLYARDDPWLPWLADERACPGGEDLSAPHAVQARSLLCLVNFARRKHGLAPVEPSRTLSAAAALKAQNIVSCGDFAHHACGLPPDRVARRLGYRGSWGENLFMGNGPAAAPRVALDRWLNSDGHRENLFGRDWRVIGIGVVTNADVGAMENGAVWVNQFGR